MAAPRETAAAVLGSTVSRQGSRAFVYFVSAVAATSGLLFGFDIAVINGAIVFLEKEWHLSEQQTEMAASSLLVGCIFGAAFGGWLSDLWGRRNALLLSAFLFAVSAIGASVPQSLVQFAAARLLGGLAIGVASVLAPLYIAEISPARIRGRLVALNQMAIVSGILLSYLANWGLSYLGTGSWRYMFAVAAIPSLVFFIALFFVPESPRWLMEKGREDEAMHVLERATGTQEATTAIDSLKEVIQLESGTLSELIAPGVRRALGLAIVLAIMQQWAGVNTVLFYGSKILSDQVGRPHRPDQLRLHDHCARFDRSPGTQGAADLLLRSDGGESRDSRAVFPPDESARDANRRSHAVVRRCLCGRSRTGRVGGAQRDLPNEDSRTRHGGGDRVALGGVHGSDHDVSDAVAHARPHRSVSDLRRHVRVHRVVRVVRRP